MKRRQLLSGIPLVFLAGCGGGLKDLLPDKLPELPVNVAVTLPPEIIEAVSDVNDIIRKVKSIGNSVPAIATGIVDKAKALIADVKAGNASSVLSNAASVLKPLVALLKNHQGGWISRSIATLLPLIGGEKVAARTGMSPAAARAVLRS